MKRWLSTNLTTMVMALFLAILTWIYLFTQGNGPAEIEVRFLPQLDKKDFASLAWEDSEGRELVPDRSLRIRVVGPKVDMSGLRLRPNVFACEFSVSSKELVESRGSFRRPLIREDFNLPHNIVVDPLPSIGLRYVRFEERMIELVADRSSVEGSLPPGYELESVTVHPRRIRARVPANAAGLERAGIRPVPVDGKTALFSLTGWFLDAAALDQKIDPVEPFSVEVKISLRPATRRIDAADLHVTAKPESLRRIELETKTVALELRGPENLVQAAAAQPSIFVPFVLVTDKDLEPAGPKNISELGCHILDPKYQGRIEVVLMPDEKPENRQVKIKVLPK